MLIFDSELFENTGTYHLEEPRGYVFSFDDALETKEFCDAYHRNREAAIFGYIAMKQQKHKWESMEYVL